MTDRRTGEDPPLELLDVAKTFRGHLGIGRFVAVDGLSLRIERGSVVGLLGPNGAGKTTTLKMALGFIRPDRGRAALFGKSPSDPSGRARIGYLPENPYFYEYLTAEEFLDYYGRLRGLPASERAAAVGLALDRVGLSSRRGLSLRKMSKGMIQRVGLAQALLHDPELVILDEPMSGLDPVGRRDVRDLIVSLRSAGRTVFFSSHILQDAEMICDRVAILDRGRLRFEGDLDGAVSRRVLWYEVSAVGPLPPGLEADVVSRDATSALLRVTDAAGLGRVLAGIDAAGGQVTAVWPRRESLEDLFLRELGRSAGVGEPR